MKEMFMNKDQRDILGRDRQENRILNGF